MCRSGQPCLLAASFPFFTATFCPFSWLNGVHPNGHFANANWAVRRSENTMSSMMLLLRTTGTRARLHECRRRVKEFIKCAHSLQLAFLLTITCCLPSIISTVGHCEALTRSSISGEEAFKKGTRY